jgi:hypothetical protein
MTTSKKTAPRRAKKARAAGTRTRTVLRQRWTEAWKGLSAAQIQLEKRVKKLLKDKGFNATEIGNAVTEIGNRLEKERKKAAKQIGGRLDVLQKRAIKEGKALGRAVDDAVRGTLATLNIPSRQEVVELTRKVDELSRKLDRVGKPTARTRASA